MKSESQYPNLPEEKSSNSPTPTEDEKQQRISEYEFLGREARRLLAELDEIYANLKNKN